MLRFACLSLALALPPPAAAFDLSLTFSDRAAAELQSRGEMVVVSAFFSGDPAPGATLPVDEMGQIFIATEEYTLWPMPQQVVLGSGLNSPAVAQVVEPVVNVNVFSARFTDENNLLDCDLVDGPVAGLAGPQAVHCRLIGE
jgi:hypothetical protein